MSHLILRQQIAFYPSRLFYSAEQSVSLFIASPRAIINYRANTTFTQIVVENLSIRWVVPVGISVKPGKALTLRLRIWIHFFFFCVVPFNFPICDQQMARFMDSQRGSINVGCLQRWETSKIASGRVLKREK